MHTTIPTKYEFNTTLFSAAMKFLMVYSDFIAVHRSTSVDASLSQQFCALRIFVRVTWVATQKTSVGRRRPMQKRQKSERTIRLMSTPPPPRWKFLYFCNWNRAIW